MDAKLETRRLSLHCGNLEKTRIPCSADRRVYLNIQEFEHRMRGRVYYLKKKFAFRSFCFSECNH